MKRYILKTLLVLSILLFTTCKEEILDVENSNNLTVENWYNTATDFELAINACYGPLMSRGLYGLQMLLTFESYSDRVLFETTGPDRITINSSTGTVDNTWYYLYFGLYRTTRVIQQLYNKGFDGIEDMDEEIYNNFLAQAKGLRGAYYFFLVSLFNQPIFYNEETLPEDYFSNLKNGTQEEFWNQIEKDLTEAIPHLPLKSELTSIDMGRVTKGAARAMLAKALLYKHYHYYCQNGNKGSSEDIADLNQAKSLLEDIMNSSEYSLVQVQEPKTKEDYVYALLSNSSFVNLVTTGGNTYKSENNQESVWEIQFEDGQAFNDNAFLPGWMSSGEMNYQWFSPHNSSYKNHELHPAMYNEFESEGAPEDFDKDPRCDATIYFQGDMMDFREGSPYNREFSAITGIKRIARTRGLELPGIAPFGLGLQKHFFPVFYDGIYAPNSSPANKRMIRYADVLLYYAEIEYILGNTTGPGLNALNLVRQRVDMPTIDILTTDAIIHERDVELAYEFSRYFDLIRWSFDPEWGIDFDAIDWGINADNSINPFVKGKNEYLPIPLYEIDLNDGELKQNPNW